MSFPSPAPPPISFPLLLILMDSGLSSLRGFSVPLPALAVVLGSMLSCQQPCSVLSFDLRTRPQAAPGCSCCTSSSPSFPRQPCFGVIEALCEAKHLSSAL